MNKTSSAAQRMRGWAAYILAEVLLLIYAAEVWGNHNLLPASSGIGLYTDWIQYFIFSGAVYEGLPGDFSTPLSGVSIGLYCSSGPTEWGTYLEGGSTNAWGQYSLVDHCS